MPPSNTIDPRHIAITEPVRDSAIPVQLIYVEMIDGVYAPIGLRKPAGERVAEVMRRRAGARKPRPPRGISETEDGATRGDGQW